ncbi:hypothetical protein JOC74_004476 [Bacillus capparidis]|uniref:Uncharacterized protein n=1 Tax=Bacillus capparidis TaxID=1840411 RepID=A0ABS4D2S7_9BACI|nr:hypothetical protein [Bacillus capparidis]
MYYIYVFQWISSVSCTNNLLICSSIIPLKEFMNNWLYGMNKERLLVGVNWNVKLMGLEVASYELFKELEERSEN